MLFLSLSSSWVSDLSPSSRRIFQSRVTASERRSGAFAFSVKPFGTVIPHRVDQSARLPMVAGASGLKRFAWGSKDARATIASISRR
ncbi:MAG: hypothetical protein RIS92_1148 [Verrucomicrobiota bacterium]